MSTIRRVGCTALIIVAACSQGSSPSVVPTSPDRLAAAKAAAGKILASDIRRDVDYLASDANMGRRTAFPGAPSPGYDSAAAYIARDLKRLGVKPMGDSGTYFLHYTVSRVTLDTTKANGAIGSEPLKWGEDFYFTISGGSTFFAPGITTGNVVYVGNGVRRMNGGIDPYQGIDFKNKWLLVIDSGGAGGGRGGAAGNVVGLDYQTIQHVVRHEGGLGILYVPTPGYLNAWNRRATSFQDLNPSVGVAYAPGFSVPRVVLSEAALRKLLAGTPVSADAVLRADSTKQYPKSADLGKKVTINFAATSLNAYPYNVVGLWEGSDPKVKDEWISLAAHLDGSVRAGGEVPGNKFSYNAADDNASGSAGNMAVARAIVAGPRPRRSILMIWDSGEEVGLWGTRTMAYGKFSSKLVLHVSNDMIGRSRAPNSARIQNLSSSDSIYITGPKLLSSNTEANLQKAIIEFPFIHTDRVYEDVSSEFYYPRTDAGPYLENGIPILQFFNGTTPEYHQPSDNPELLDINKIMNVSKLSYGALWLAADDIKKPLWDGIIPRTLWWVKPKNPK